MAQTNFNVGAIANDGTGDALRDAFIAQQAMNTDLYTNKVDKVVGKDLSENDFTLKDKLDNLDANAEENVQADWLQDDDTQDDYIKNKPDQLFASVGHFHYNDLATQTTPISVTAYTETLLTNDTDGSQTNRSQAPYGVSDVWFPSAFDFSQLSIGDTIDLRVDLLLTTDSVNQKYKIFLRVGETSDYEYDLHIFDGQIKEISTDENIVGFCGFSLDYEEHLTNLSRLYIVSDDDARVKVNGWYTRIVRKSINVIDFNSDPLKLDKVSASGVERAYIINADGSQGTKAISEFGADENNLYRSFFQYSARNDFAGIVNLNAPVALVTSGTQSVVGITGVSKYASIPLQNYLSATPNGSNCGWKQGTLADGIIRQGFDIYMIWANNDANVNCETTVGSYSLLTAIPNVAKSDYTTDFFGIGNDVGDANLSFYCKRNNAPASYIKVPTNSSFPAHDTTSAYILRMEAPCTEVDADKYIKMTLTNIITGATISHTFTYTEVPMLYVNVLCVINRNNRNTGVATNIRPSKIHYSRLIY